MITTNIGLESNCFKEYASDLFHLSAPLDLTQAQTIAFNSITNESAHLPSVLQDTLVEDSRIYFLQWKKVNSQLHLYVTKKSDPYEWKNIELNYHPLRTLITDDQIFLFGAKELFIVSLASSQQRRIMLQSAAIVDAQLSFNEEGKSGVYVVYFSSKLGYFTKHYTSESQGSLWQTIKSICHFSFSNLQPYQYFKILLPNVIAVVIDNNMLYLYDLHQMKSTALTIPLNPVQQIKRVCLKWRLIESQHPYNDIFQLFIARSNCIEKFKVNLKRKECKVQINSVTTQEKVELDRIVSGEIVDWGQSAIEKAADHIWAEGIIQDFQIYNNCVIYRCVTDSHTSIPHLTIVSLKDQNRNNCIISQEMQVWKKYLTNSGLLQSFDFSENIDEHSKTGPGKRWIKKQANNLDRLLKWKNNNSFVSFFIRDSQLYLVRKGSLTLFAPIDEFQYAVQLYTEAMRREDQKKLDGCMHEQQSRDEVNLRLVTKSMEMVLSTTQLNYYRQLLSDIKRCIDYGKDTEMIKDEQLISNNLTVIQTALQDKICHFARYLNYSHRVLQIKEPSLKNTLVYKLMMYFSQTYDDQQLRSSLGDKVLNLFVRSFRGRFRLGQQIALIFSQLFQNTLPDCYLRVNYNAQTEFTQTGYLQFMIGMMIKHADHDELLLSIQENLRKYIGAFTASLTEQQLTGLLIKNMSMFQVFMISHPSNEQLEPILGHILKSDKAEQMIFQLRKIKHLIINQLEKLFEVKLKINQMKLLQKQYYSLGTKNTPEEQRTDGKGVSLKSILCQQYLLFNPEQSFRNSCQQIQSIFSKISAFCSEEDFNISQQSIVKCYNRQMSLDTLNQCDSHMAELDEMLLRNYVNLFNTRVTDAKDTHDRALMERQCTCLDKILDLISVALQSYRRRMRRYYKVQKMSKHDSFFGQICSEISQDEKLMTSRTLSAPIKLQNLLCSRVTISLSRLLLSTPEILASTLKQNIFSSPHLPRYVIDLLLGRQSLRSSDIDIIYYLLIKKGQRLVRSIFRQSNSQRVGIFVSQLREKRIHQLLVEIANQQLQSQSIDLSGKRFLNPFGLC